MTPEEKDHFLGTAAIAIPVAKDCVHNAIRLLEENKTGDASTQLAEAESLLKQLLGRLHENKLD